MSSGGESGSGCGAAYAVVGENGVTSGKIDEFSLNAAKDDEDRGYCEACAWPGGIGIGTDDEWGASGSAIQFEYSAESLNSGDDGW